MVPPFLLQAEAPFSLLLFMFLQSLMFLSLLCSLCRLVRSLITTVVLFLSLTLVVFRTAARGLCLVLALGAVIRSVFGSSTGFIFLPLSPPASRPLPLPLLLLRPPLHLLLSGTIVSVISVARVYRL